MKPARRFPTIERLEDRIAPATFLVTHLLDDNSPGSLRKAVNDSNNGDGPDTITFKAGLTGTIVLALGSLGFDEGITIKGPGSAKLTIDGAGNNLFLFSNVPSDDPVSVSGLTLENGAASGTGRLIYSSEPTALSDVKLIGNVNANFDLAKGGGLYVDTSGNITIKNCEFTGNRGAGSGGGAYLSASGAGAKVAISGSTFADNESSGAGGGLFVDLAGTGASLTVDHTTFTGNSAMQAGVGKGGAMQIQAGGGGLVVIKNSTFTDNRSGDSADSGGGAIFQIGGKLFVQGSHFSANSGSHGGAIAATGAAEVNVQKSQFNLNRALYLPAGEGGGALHLDGASKWRIAGCTFTGNSALASGGAIVVQSNDGEITGSTFRANSSAEDGGAIHFRNSTATVKGCLFSANTADAGGAVYTYFSTSITVTGSRFTGNLATVEGGALGTFDGPVTVSGSTFDHNVSLGAGGAVSATSTFTSLGNVYRDNYAAGSGGALAVPLGGIGLTIRGGSMIDNRAGGAGGGIFINDADSILIEKVLIRDNHATGDGGGVSLRTNFAPTSVVVTGNTLLDNTTGSASSGGGLYLTSLATVMLTKNKITGNFAGNGGGVFNAGNATATDNKIFDNLALANPDTAGL